MDGRRQRLQDACLYLVCDAVEDRVLTGALAGGVDVVQLRAKDADDEQIVAAGRRFAARCAEHGALFILNDRPDLVEATGADGVHVGQEDMEVEQVRWLLGPEPLIGLSTHTPEQVRAANDLDLDYTGVGPVHATPTKPGRAAVGAELVREASARAARPFFAIGGIDAETIKPVLRAGARRVAVVRAIAEAADPAAAARALRAVLDRAGMCHAGA